jgi:hypothetical protein
MDLTTLLVIGLIIVVVVFLISRNRGGSYGGSPMSRTQTGGVDRPTYDDTGYTSSGSIGGGPAAPPQERSVGGATGSSGRTNDDPNYRSGGSIG